ncbi:MAG: cupin domain-containing protein [Amaricoccus sp.]
MTSDNHHPTESDISHPLEHVLLIARTHAATEVDAPPEKVSAGSGKALDWATYSDPARGFHVGHWQAEPGIRAVHYTETELCHLLEGRVRLSDASGAIEFGPGESFVISPGFTGTWESIGRVTKLYAILDPAPAR